MNLKKNENKIIKFIKEKIFQKINQKWKKYTDSKNNSNNNKVNGIS